MRKILQVKRQTIASQTLLILRTDTLRIEECKFTEHSLQTRFNKTNKAFARRAYT